MNVNCENFKPNFGDKNWEGKKEKFSYRRMMNLS